MSLHASETQKIQMQKLTLAKTDIVVHKNETFYIWIYQLTLTDFYNFCIVLIMKKFCMQR